MVRSDEGERHVLYVVVVVRRTFSVVTFVVVAVAHSFSDCQCRGESHVHDPTDDGPHANELTALTRVACAIAAAGRGGAWWGVAGRGGRSGRRVVQGRVFQRVAVILLRARNTKSPSFAERNGRFIVTTISRQNTWSSPVPDKILAGPGGRACGVRDIEVSEKHISPIATCGGRRSGRGRAKFARKHSLSNKLAEHSLPAPPRHAWAGQ